MTPRFGIDTSILVRLLTGKPEQVYAHCVSALQDLIAEQGAQILASNTVIGEAYVRRAAPLRRVEGRRAYRDAQGVAKRLGLSAEWGRRYSLQSKAVPGRGSLIA